MDTRPLGVAGNKYRPHPKTHGDSFRQMGPSVSGNVVTAGKIGLRTAPTPLTIPLKMAKIPALSVLSTLSAFPRNSPGGPVDVGIDGRGLYEVAGE